MSQIAYWLRENRYVIIADDALGRLAAYRQTDPRTPEAGGILLGYRHGPHLAIVDVTVPGKKDECKRTAFSRRDEAHGVYFLRRQRADPYISYIGEWHTHPESCPAPSSLDKKEWSRIAAQCSGELVFIIQGTDRLKTYSSRWIDFSQPLKELRT